MAGLAATRSDFRPCAPCLMQTQFDKFLLRYKAVLLALLVLAGIAVRMLWLTTTSTGLFNIGEAQNVAVAFSQTGTISDAFRPGQGPTAHMMPIMPIIAGTVYRAFGTESSISNGILTAVSLLLVFGGYLLLFRAFGRLGTPIASRMLGFAILALFPLNVSLETVGFRVWEGGLAVFMSALCLDQLLRLDGAEKVSTFDIAAMGLLAAACLFVSPPVGVAAYFGGGFLMIRRIERRRWPTVIGIVAVAATIVLSPWLIRNMAVMDSPILLRDNFGLELAQANHAAAVNSADPRETFIDRHREIHPFGDNSDAAYRAMQAAGGEAAYAEKLGAEAKRWIQAHPEDFAQLSLRHLREMLFPPEWLWNQFGTSSNSVTLKLGANWTLSLLALTGIAVGLRQVGARFGYVAMFALLPLLPYVVVQPTLRYRYLVFALFVFISADVAHRAVARLLRLRPSTAPGHG